jgi:Ubiquitin carboxyl-terminal hydrolase
MLAWGVMASFPLQRPSSALQATKKLDLWASPEYLVLTLKRFSFNAEGVLQSKLHSLVDFPLTGLDLSQYALRQQVSCCLCCMV